MPSSLTNAVCSFPFSSHKAFPPFSFTTLACVTQIFPHNFTVLLQSKNLGIFGSKWPCGPKGKKLFTNMQKAGLAYFLHGLVAKTWYDNVWLDAHANPLASHSSYSSFSSWQSHSPALVAAGPTFQAHKRLVMILTTEFSICKF